MVFALPPGMAQALELVHRGSTFRVLGGSRQRASRWTPEYVKLLLSPRHSRGITLVYSGREQPFLEARHVDSAEPGVRRRLRRRAGPERRAVRPARAPDP